MCEARCVGLFGGVAGGGWCGGADCGAAAVVFQPDFPTVHCRGRELFNVALRDLFNGVYVVAMPLRTQV